MTVETIMAQLEAKGSESIKKILLKHGVKEPFFGVKVEDLKLIQKEVKKDYELSKNLYNTGNADAMYLAGLIADESKMTKKDLSAWVKKAVSNNISEYTVPWIAAESNFGFELAQVWIDAKEEFIAAAGWATLCSVVAIRTDDKLDMPALKKLMDRVQKNIHKAPNRVRSKMNAFIIAVGSYVAPLTNDAIATAQQIGEVQVIVEGTACKVPDAITYINKVKSKNAIGKKKKMARC